MHKRLCGLAKEYGKSVGAGFRITSGVSLPHYDFLDFRAAITEFSIPPHRV
jgi:hypothetical protein